MPVGEFERGTRYRLMIAAAHIALLAVAAALALFDYVYLAGGDASSPYAVQGGAVLAGTALVLSQEVVDNVNHALGVRFGTTSACKVGAVVTWLVGATISVGLLFTTGVVAYLLAYTSTGFIVATVTYLLDLGSRSISLAAGRTLR